MYETLRNCRTRHRPSRRATEKPAIHRPRPLGLLAVALLTLTPSSAQEPVLPNTPFDYTRQIPAHYLVDALPGPQQPSAAAIDNEPATNRVTDAGATLGRVLFYDRKLSANGTVSCSSCHVQEQGFSDARRLSVGVHGGRTRRHSMGLVNSRFYESGRFFWDERAATLEEQVLQPIQDPVEMDLSLEELVDIVESQAYYPRLFVQAFGDATINTERIGRALAQFVRSINSYNSRYDQGRATVNNANADFPNFSAQENRGKDLFFRPRQGVRCVTCHGTESFSGVRLPGSNVLAMNNGLDAVSTNDLGVFETTNNPADLGKFKTPSLRNVNERAPYMHDGRFATLEDVVAFYSNDIQNHENLAPQLRQNNGQPVRFNFNAQERTDLVAFLRTLSDTSVMSDARFSDPFVETETAVSALSLSSASYQVSEGEQALNVVVVREGSVDPAVDVTLVSQPGSATAGLDFEAVSARLSWGAGEAAMRTVTIPIVDDVLVEDEENFSIALTAFSADATPGSVTSANVVIADDDEFTSTVCVPSSTELCLGESGRFRARLAWSTGEQGGAATAVPLEDGGSSGLFYFFEPTNIEMLLKVLDACTPDLGNRHWIFYAATTDLAFELEVTDTWTGQIRRYSNPEGRVALPVADTQAFDCSLE